MFKYFLELVQMALLKSVLICVLGVFLKRNSYPFYLYSTFQMSNSINCPILEGLAQTHSLGVLLN
jgi:hypothetical protein